MFRVYGQKTAIDFLKDSIHKSRLHHAYLFSGPSHIGKFTVAIQLAQAVNCLDEDPPCRICHSCVKIEKGIHPDVRIIGTEMDDTQTASGSIGIDVVGEIHGMANLKPFEGKSHVFIIDRAERLTRDAANALLKILEEPPDGSLLILVTTDIRAILPTVMSRSQVVDFLQVPQRRIVELLRDDYAASVEQADHISRLSQGRVGWAIEAVTNPEVLAFLHQRLERISEVCSADVEDRFIYANELSVRFQRDRETVREEFRLWVAWWRDIFLILQGRGEQITFEGWRNTLIQIAGGLSMVDTLDWIERLYESLNALDRNVIPRLVLEALMLKLPGGSKS